jgi:hypothetical protein
MVRECYDNGMCSCLECGLYHRESLGKCPNSHRGKLCIKCLKRQKMFESDLCFMCEEELNLNEREKTEKLLKKI